MPKIKTHKSTAKRFRYSGTGKLMRMRQGKGHLRRKKSSKVKATYRYAHEVEAKGERDRVKRLAPYK
ncbi:MAG: 50S ribosomal protein L35 [Chloroflexota bacterium]|nr:50S ribosomal protein L35 [Chloroflexota bacterium]